LTAAQNSTIQEAGVAAAIEVTLFIAVLILTPTWFGAGIGAVAALWWSTQHPAIQDVAAALFEAPFLRIGCQINGDAAMRRCGDAANGKDFVGALGPLVIVFILGVISFLGTRIRR
jgi:hypothetical protein